VAGAKPDTVEIRQDGPMASLAKPGLAAELQLA
jgi:hypothetical protein